MKIYTKTGDDGLTGLLANRRVPKDDARIEAYGTVDELNALLGSVRSGKIDPAADALLTMIQNQLFVVGSALADPMPDGPFHNVVTPDHATTLEAAIDTMEAELVPLTQFILPGGTQESSHVHLARTVARRAERQVVHLARQPGEHVPHDVIIYLNRLSDLLFVLARALNHRAGVADVPWSGI